MAHEVAPVIRGLKHAGKNPYRPGPTRIIDISGHRQIFPQSMPPAARNLFEKRFLDFQKFFIKVCLGPVFFAAKKNWRLIKDDISSLANGSLPVLFCFMQPDRIIVR
jgi:hypothetical protein